MTALPASALALAEPAAAPAASREGLKIVVVGHVDHGKSTVIGRLLHDTGSLPEGKIEELKAISERRGMPLEWSFVLDAFQAERDQAITIDTTRVWFKSAARDYVVIDAPGHREFLKNMVTGAASADAAVLVIDALEGVREQSKRHGYLLHLLGVRQVVVAVNKMDLADFSRTRFEAVRAEILAYLAEIGVTPAAVVPISGRHGDNLVRRSGNTGWYQGPALLDALDGLAPAAEESGRPLRFPVQAVYKFDERRIVAGRIESGVLRVGDRLTFSPSGKSARVASIEAWPDVFPPLQAAAGSSVGITLDDHIFVERGDIASHAEGDLPKLSPVFRASLFWLGDAPLTVGRSYRLRLATAEAQVTVEAVERVIDTDSLAHSEAGAVPRHGIAEVVLRARDLLALDEHADNPATGRFVLTEAGQIVGGGLVSLKGYPDQRRVQPKPAANLFAVDHTLTPRARARRNGHEGAVLWFTGLSGAGKSTLAMEVERRLFARGLQIYVLDGDNVRRGLNADLGFSPDARAENIRRIGEVAALFADAGMIAITAFISPYRSDRARARAAAEAQRPGTFHEIHIKADLAVCEERDPKGLYKRARNGEIPDFTGISAPYEPPEAPELVVDTGALGIDQAAELVIDYITRTIVLPEAVAI